MVAEVLKEEVGSASRVVSVAFCGTLTVPGSVAARNQYLQIAKISCRSAGYTLTSQRHSQHNRPEAAPLASGLPSCVTMNVAICARPSLSPERK